MSSQYTDRPAPFRAIGQVHPGIPSVTYAPRRATGRDDSADLRCSTVFVANPRPHAARVTLRLSAPAERRSVVDWGRILVELPASLADQLGDGRPGAGVHRVDATTLQILTPDARIGPFRLAPNETHTMRLRCAPSHRRPLGVRVDALDALCVVQEHVVGGVRVVGEELLLLRAAAEPLPYHG